MTLDDAIKLLTENYKIAQKHEFIAKPLSWALYHTWDEIEKKRNGGNQTMSNILKKTNGKPWLTDENKTVPAKCPICGAKMDGEEDDG